jgi:hypothetical protein
MRAARHSLIAALCGALVLAATAQARVHRSGASWSLAKAVESQQSAAAARNAAQLHRENLLLRRFWQVHGPGGIAPGGRLLPASTADFWQTHAPADREG